LLVDLGSLKIKYELLKNSYQFKQAFIQQASNCTCLIQS